MASAGFSNFSFSFFSSLLISSISFKILAADGYSPGNRMISCYWFSSPMQSASYSLSLILTYGD